MICCQSCGQRLLKKKPVKSEDPAWSALLDAWWSRYGSTPVSARELHQLPGAQAIRPSLSAFGMSLGKAWRGREVVNCRRVVLEEWGYAKVRKKGNIVVPTMWALEEVQDNRQAQKGDADEAR